MIETLQRKFVLTAMTAISVLLLVLLGAINLINGWSVNRQTDRTLAMLSEREGILPPQRDLEEKEPKDSLYPSRFKRECCIHRFESHFFGDEGRG